MPNDWDISCNAAGKFKDIKPKKKPTRIYRIALVNITRDLTGDDSRSSSERTLREIVEHRKSIFPLPLTLRILPFILITFLSSILSIIIFGNEQFDGCIFLSRLFTTLAALWVLTTGVVQWRHNQQHRDLTLSFFSELNCQLLNFSSSLSLLFGPLFLIFFLCCRPYEYEKKRK